MDAYREFIASKVKLDSRMGFAVAADAVNPMLKPHQRDIVRWAVAGGRRAVFAAFGLGKTPIQLEIMRHVAAREGGRQLIIAPLGVRQDFRADAAKFGTSFAFIRRDAEVEGPGLYLTNYESVRDGRLSVSRFNAASLDEASVLRSFGSLTYQTFPTLFESVKYRFVATATPSPNTPVRPKPILSGSGCNFQRHCRMAVFLGIGFKFNDFIQAIHRIYRFLQEREATSTSYTPTRKPEFWTRSNARAGNTRKWWNK